MTQRVVDEYGRTWVVDAHDPARGLVLELGRKGLDYVVLPVYTIATGLAPRGHAQPDTLVAKARLDDCLMEVFGVL